MKQFRLCNWLTFAGKFREALSVLRRWFPLSERQQPFFLPFTARVSFTLQKVAVPLSMTKVLLQISIEKVSQLFRSIIV